MPPVAVPIRRDDLPHDTVGLARYLLGALVVRALPGGVASGRIVETEAYLVGDAACHAYRRQTPRNRSLFLERGHAYVYVAYGISFMLNVSGNAAGIGEGVLIRALVPLSGIALMQANRGGVRLPDIARGPGRLTQALGIDRSLDGLDLCAGPTSQASGSLWLAQDGHTPGPIGVGPRIGITRDIDRPLRFFVRDDPFVSGPKRLHLPQGLGDGCG